MTAAFGVLGLSAALSLSVPAGSPGAAAAPVDLVWATLSPSTSPPALQMASAVYDSDNHTIVVFGGLTPEGSVSDSTWVWNGTTWTDYSPAQIEEPPGRSLASMAFDPALHQLILFGGRNAAGHQLGDTWAWNGASWYNLGQRQSSSPGARDGAAFAYDGRGHLVLFGGEAAASEGLLPGASSPGSPGQNPGPPGNPPPSASVLADTWEWGSNGWSQVSTSGPPARVQASAAFDPASGTVVLFGGASTPVGNPPVSSGSPLGDTWTWTGSGWAPAGTVQPPPRSAAVLADDPLAGGLVLFGGGSSKGPLADTWLWNGSGWAQLPAGGSPPARSAAIGDFLSADGQLVVFGGAGQGGTLLASTVVLTAGAPVALGPATTGPATTLPRVIGPIGSATPSTPAAEGVATQPTPRSRAISPGGSSAASGGSAVHLLRRGQVVSLHGSGFSPGVKVTITFHSAPVIVGDASTDARGDFVVNVTVPGSAAAGTHRFEASGPTSKGVSTMVLATVEVAAPHASSRPSPGTTGALVGIALAVPLCTWFSLGVSGRLRRKTS